MASQVDGGFRTFTAGEALATFRRVKTSSTTDQTVVLAGAGEQSLGVTQHAAASGSKVTVKLWSAEGTFICTAASAMATRNGAVYGAASGKVDDAASGASLGVNLDTASGDGSQIEVCPKGSEA